MGKKFKKLLAMALSLAITATFCVVPMTANAEVPQDETYDTADEITLSDLGLNPGNFENAISAGTHNYTATSTSKSVALKFKWNSNVSGEGWFVSFDADWNFAKSAWFRGGNILFCFNGGDIYKEIGTPITSGTHDVEFGRKYVTGGANTGKYYVYLIVDDELLAEGYTTFDSPANTIAFNGSEIAAQRFADYVAPEDQETYDTADEITLSDLGLNPGNFENAISAGEYNYTGYSGSNSVALKFKWNASVTGDGMSIFLDKAWNWGLSVWFKGDNIIFCFNTDIQSVVTPPITSGTHDVEFGRKLVLSGANKDKYYIYLTVDNQPLADGYAECSNMANKIAFNGDEIAAQRFANLETPETYEDYDEVYYSNLKYGGQYLGTETDLTGSKTFTYDRTSETGSAILKYRWTVGSNVEQQVSIGKTPAGMSFIFGAWIRPADTEHDKGRAWIIGGPENNAPITIVAGNSYDIEIGRLKVKTGRRTGQYYVYYKINGQLAVENYVSATTVDVNGNYTDRESPCSVLSGEIFISGNGDKISEIPYTQEYETYDEVDYDDLSLDGEPLSPNGTDMTGGTRTLTYVPESPTGSAIVKYRWKVGEAPAFQLSFGKVGTEIAYPFAAWMDQATGFQNGRMWLCPGNYNREMNCAFAIAPNSSHNVEFARLKVKNGPKKGQYHVYIKIDDVLFNEVYAPADTVDADGNYHDYRENSDNNILSGELLFNFSSSAGSIISAYKDALNGEHLGIRGDFNEDGIFTATDLATLRKILLDAQDTSDMPSGISDFNNDKVTNLLDLVCMKKYLAPVNNYAKSESLALGTQEHYLEDETKTAQYIADASKALGAKSYRLSMSIASLFWTTSVNDVIIREENLNKVKAQIAALKENGITDILYVSDSFLLPYNYGTLGSYHNLTVPNPKTEKEAYENWLKVNANAFKMLAKECPEIKFFEPGNELNLAEAKLEKYGIGWDSTANRASYRYTVKEKAGILADLCWNVSNAVKSVDSANQVTTPSISVQDSGAVQSEFAQELYKAIESGSYPSNQTLGDKRVDNYFTILNIHIYPLYETAASNLNTYVNQVNSFYNVAKAHNDGGSRVWITETGLSTSGSRTDDRDKDTVANIITSTLNRINTDLTFVDTVFIYKIADVSVDKGMSPQETDYGLFFSGDDLDCAPYGVKPSANAVASFFRGAAGADWINWLIGLYH